jgi:hypothetical protein
LPPPASPIVLEAPGDWATAVAALPAIGPLPIRTVLVPSERHAHALRRALLRDGKASALAGTRFVGPATLAEEIVRSARINIRLGEGSLRAARLQTLLSTDLPLEYYDLHLLRSTPGWPEAFARAIGDLESAGVRSAKLPETTPQWRDLSLLWRSVDAAAGSSWSQARLYQEAAALLEAGARLEAGPVLAAVTGRETAAQARFLRALPGATLALHAARPVRERHLTRVAALFGQAARAALEATPPPASDATELDLLRRHLFSRPEQLADPARRRSSGPDGTVTLEEHAGVEAELTAAIEWVAHEVLERKTPLEGIAILVPSRDPLLPLLAARLTRLELPGGPLPVHVAGGLPATSRSSGARALGLLRALQGFLPASAVATILPSLRTPIEDRNHLSLAEATSLAWSLGTLGGNAAEPARALDWAARAATRQASLRGLLAELEAHPDANEREGRQLREALVALDSARPALEALVGLARLVVEDRPLSSQAPAFLSFLETWLLQPGGDAPVESLLAGAFDWLEVDALGAEMRGLDALALIEEQLLGLRLPTERFGTPAVFLGTLADAQGLDFEAVRVLGLCEGALPSSVREDPVLPDRLRSEVAPLALPTSGDRVLAQLHAFDQAVRGAGRAITLSSPRSDAERSERETSSILLEVGAALGRPDPKSNGAVIPDLRSLDRTSFGPAREAAAARRAAQPITAAEWLDRAAACGEVPASWGGAAHLDLAQILARRAPSGLGPADGLIGTQGPLPKFPGLDPARPTSASALNTLLGCPLRFLQERILRWGEPSDGAPVAELDPLTYGSLFHEVMEQFGAEHGAPFVTHDKSLAYWKHAAEAIADARFSSLLEGIPFVGPAAVEHQRQRLRRDVASYLDYDWQRPLTRFVAVERAFGQGEPFSLSAGGVPLHLRGSIDRLDVEGRHLLLRDYKTGRDHPRTGDEEGPTLGRDLQIGIYGLVARKFAKAWDLPKDLQVAYVYPRAGEERAFRDDYPELEAATKEWLAVAAGLLSSGRFPPTPNTGDCAFCPFTPLCGTSVPARAAAATGQDDAVVAFLELKLGVAE